MILSDREIWMEIQSGRLTFDPEIAPEQVSPSAVDLRLSDEFTVLPSPLDGVQTVVDVSKVSNVEEVANQYGTRQVIREGDDFELHSGSFVLAYTREYVRLPNYLAGRIEGRSSLSRLGITIHQTAPTVHATFEGQLRLELANSGPFVCRLKPGLRICQLILERLSSPSQTTLRSMWQSQRQA